MGCGWGRPLSPRAPRVSSHQPPVSPNAPTPKKNISSPSVRDLLPDHHPHLCGGQSPGTLPVRAGRVGRGLPDPGGACRRVHGGGWGGGLNREGVCGWGGGQGRGRARGGGCAVEQASLKPEPPACCVERLCRSLSLFFSQARPRATSAASSSG